MSERDLGKNARFVQTVVETYGLQLHGYLVKRLRAGEDVNDIAQEVYLRLLRLKRSDLIRQPVAYVYFVAAQVVGEQRLRDAKRAVVYDSELLEKVAEGYGVANDLSDHEHTVREVSRLLRALKGAHRTVFLLRKREGLSGFLCVRAITVPEGGRRWRSRRS